MNNILDWFGKKVDFKEIWKFSKIFKSQKLFQSGEISNMVRLFIIFSNVWKDSLRRF